MILVHLKAIVFNTFSEHSKEYPYSLPWLKTMTELDMSNEVIIFAGDNGCGKSTLMSHLADSLNLYRIQSSENQAFKQRKDIKLIKPIYKTTRALGYFFEAEAFITYLHYLSMEKKDAIDQLSIVEKEYKNKSEYAKAQARAPYQNTLSQLNNLYEFDLTKRSHGEAYLDFFASRMKPNQLLLLDEPETPLSSQNQLTLLAMIKEATENNCQVIIATHSPILMCYPNAFIYEIRPEGIERVKYEDIESVKLLKQFINAPEQFLRHL